MPGSGHPWQKPMDKNRLAQNRAERRKALGPMPKASATTMFGDEGLYRFESSRQHLVAFLALEQIVHMWR